MLIRPCAYSEPEQPSPAQGEVVTIKTTDDPLTEPGVTLELTDVDASTSIEGTVRIWTPKRRSRTTSPSSFRRP